MLPTLNLQTLKFEHNGVQIHIDVKTDDVTEFQEARLTNDVTFIIRPSDLDEKLTQSQIIQKVFEYAEQFKTQEEFTQEFVNYAENFLPQRTVKSDGSNLKISGKPALETEDYGYVFNANIELPEFWTPLTFQKMYQEFALFPALGNALAGPITNYDEKVSNIVMDYDNDGYHVQYEVFGHRVSYELEHLFDGRKGTDTVEIFVAKDDEVISWLTDVTIDENDTTFEAMHTVTYNLLEETKKSEFVQYERFIEHLENDDEIVIHSIEDDVITLTYNYRYYNEVYGVSINMNVFDSTNWVDEFNSWKTRMSHVYFGLQHQTKAKIAKKVNHVDVVIDEKNDMYATFMLGDIKVTMFISNDIELNYTRHVVKYFKAVKDKQELVIYREDIPSDVAPYDRFDYYIQQILAM